MEVKGGSRNIRCKGWAAVRMRRKEIFHPGSSSRLELLKRENPQDFVLGLWHAADTLTIASLIAGD